MKRKVFASVLSALMVTSTVSGSLMADVNEETSIEETEVVIEETEQTEEDLEEDVIEEITNEDEVISEVVPDGMSEEITENTTEENNQDSETIDEIVAEDEAIKETGDDEEMPVPVLDETEIPEVDTQKLTNSLTLKSGQKLSYYDEDGDGRSDVLYVEGTGDIYDTTRGFPDSTYVKKVVVSEGITSIGNYNFDGFGALEDVTLPSTLTKIGDRAFSYCTKLKTIKIPTGVKSIGYAAFTFDSALETIEIPASVEKLAESTFTKCTALKSVVLNKGITSIDAYCFNECAALENIVIPSSVKVIGKRAFYNDRKLKSVTFNEGLEEVHEYAFDDCYSLASFKLPKTLTRIDRYAFSGVPVTELTIPAGVKTISEGAFSYTYAVEKLTIEYGVTTIGENAFIDLGVQDLVIPDSVTEIKHGAFQGAMCKNVTLPNGLTKIEEAVFNNCGCLENITIPSSVKEIEFAAFSYGNNLKKITIPDTVTKVSDYAFMGSKAEVTISCKTYPSGGFVDHSNVVLIHKYDHSSDATCNNCGAVREIHVVTMDQFVERLYTTCLGRKSEAAGKEYWIKKLVNGATGAEAAHQFFFSSEFTSKKLSDKEFITRLYKTFMDRNPDTNGLNYWLGKIKSGYTREQVFQGFINSQEWADMCLQYGIKSGGTKASSIEKEPSKGCVDFATRLYTTCLGRKPDEAGLKDWVTKLTTLKTTGTKAAHGFFFSKEFTSKNYSNEEYIKRLYRTFMGREADQGGINYWLGKIKGGYTREQVFQGFANSAEFEKICIQYGILK